MNFRCISDKDSQISLLIINGESLSFLVSKVERGSFCSLRRGASICAAHHDREARFKQREGRMLVEYDDRLGNQFRVLTVKAQV